MKKILSLLIVVGCFLSRSVFANDIPFTVDTDESPSSVVYEAQDEDFLKDFLKDVEDRLHNVLKAEERMDRIERCFIFQKGCEGIAIVDWEDLVGENPKPLNNNF